MYKEFDLEKAIAGEPLITRDGRSVAEFYCFKTANQDVIFRCAAVISGHINAYNDKGRWASSLDSPYDLFMAPVKKQEWINIHYHLDKSLPTGQSYWVMEQKTFSSEEEARKFVEETGAPNYMKSVLIREWEE